MFCNKTFRSIFTMKQYLFGVGIKTPTMLGSHRVDQHLGVNQLQGETKNIFFTHFHCTPWKYSHLYMQMPILQCPGFVNTMKGNWKKHWLFLTSCFAMPLPYCVLCPHNVALLLAMPVIHIQLHLKWVVKVGT